MNLFYSYDTISLDIIKGVLFLDNGSITTTILFSEALQEDMKLLIYIPANYTPMMEYPLAIASDGNDYFQLGSLSRVLDEQIVEGDIEEHIVVGIPYINSQDRRQKYMPDGTKHEAYLHFLSEELLPYLEATYSLSTDPDTRIVMGDSQAATIALISLARFPNLFHRAILHSPQVTDEVLSIAESLSDTIDYQIYHAIGRGELVVHTRDGKVKDFLTPNRALHDILKLKNINYEYIELEGEHTWKMWKPDLPKAISRIFNN